MPVSANRTRLFIILSVTLMLVAGVTASILLPRASALVEGKFRQGQTERAREIAEKAKKHHQEERAKDGREAKRSPKKRAEQAPQKLERDGVQIAVKQDDEAKLEWPSFKLLDNRVFGEESEEGFDKPREAAEFFKKKRLPAGEKVLPVEEYFQAQEQMRQMPQFSTSLNRFLTPAEATSFRLSKEAAVPTAGWTPLGPGNIGGRTRAILINPQDTNVMYAAGVSGGVWKSTNAGGLWTPISDLIANITVSTMVFEPGNPNVIYVGTGEGVYGAENDTQFDFRGAGIFKTADGGATWARLQGTTTTDFYYVNKLAVSTIDKNRLYAATQTGVMRSSDGGVTWTKVLDPIGPRGVTVNAGCLDLALRTDKPTDVVFTACGNSEQATVYRNADASGAGTWESVLTETGMGRTSLAIAPSNQEVVYALATSIERNQFSNSLYAVFRSNAGGASDSWNAQVRNTSANKINRAILSIPPLAVATDCGYGFEDGYVGQGFYDLVIAVDPVDSNRVWVGGIDVARSDDGGVNWGFGGPAYLNNYYELGAIHPDQHAIVFHPRYDGAANQIMYLGNDGGLFRTNNARAAVATSPTSVCNYAQVAVKWTNLNNNYGVTQFYNGAVMPDGKSYFGGTQDNGTLLGTDGAGINGWKMINGGDGGYAAVDQFDPNILFASYTGFSFRKSTDGGITFGNATLGLSDDGQFITPFVMDPSDSQRLWTGGAYLWRTTTSAAIWERASAITAGDELVSSIAIAPTDSNRMLVGMADGYILRNSTALTSTALTSWPAVQVRGGYVSSVAFDPNNKDIAYATYSTFGGAHVYRTTDGGQSWSAIDRQGSQNGVPDVPVHSIAIDPSNTARLYVGTDVGVFVTNDGGENWAVETTGFPNVITEALQVNIAGGVTSVYAFTHGRGVWRTVINNSGCSYSLSPATRNVAASAANGIVNVKASPSGCNWTAASNASWLRVTGSGSSDGTASFQADENLTFASRTATATIAGHTFTIIQAAWIDVDAPVLAITDPAVPPTIPNTSGLINLAGTATDNNAVTSVTWQTDRGAAGTATYSATTGRWTATGIPLSPGNNLITVTALDAAGNVARASVIVRSLPEAVLITVAGNGVPGTLGDGGQATAARMSRPWQIAFDGAGNLYIGDYDNHAIRKVASNGVITTIAGTPGMPGFSGDGGLAASALLANPLGMAFDGAGNLYFADSGNNRIRKVTAADGKISTIAGNGSAAYGGDGGPATDASLNFPYGVALDKDGNIYFADFGNSRVRKITLADSKISTVAGNGNATFNGDDKPATEASLNSPLNVTFDKDGNLIITDNLNYRIRRVSAADGKISTIVGTGVSGFSGDGGLATAARVAQPGGAVYDAAGNLYFVDRGNNRVRKVSAGVGIITTIAGSGTAG
ncbi:MAG: BACON domain-containing carbohydrate-binding protein, partial [Blastocatellia bacterium]